MKTIMLVIMIMVSGAASAQEYFYSEADDYLYRASDLDKFTISPHLSTLGYGVDASIALSPLFAIRGQYNYFRGGYGADISGSRYQSRIILNTSGGFIDYSPFDGFRVSLGALYNDNRIDAKVVGPTNIAGVAYSSAQVSNTTIRGGFKNNVSPYAGVGYSSNKDGLAIDVSAGLLYQGSSRVDITTDGTISNGSLLALRQDAQKQLNRLRVYPVVSIGLAYTF